MFHLHLNVERFVKAGCAFSEVPGGDYKCFLFFFALFDLTRDVVKPLWRDFKKSSRDNCDLYE